MPDSKKKKKKGEPPSAVALTMDRDSGGLVMAAKWAKHSAMAKDLGKWRRRKSNKRGRSECGMLDFEWHTNRRSYAKLHVLNWCK